MDIKLVLVCLVIFLAGIKIGMEIRSIIDK